MSTSTHTTCALWSTGEVECWGFLIGAVPGPFATVPGGRSLVAGVDGHCVIDGEGAPWCLVDDTGPVGDVRSLGRTPARVPGVRGVDELAIGSSHLCARSGGSILCWGDNDHGQLGDGTGTPRSTPRAVTLAAPARRVAARGSHTCALLQNGEVWCWGLGLSGQLGDLVGGEQGADSTLPMFSGMSGASDLVVGPDYTCATRGAELVCWGAHPGPRDPLLERPLAASVVAGAPTRGLVAGGQHLCGLTEDGTVVCWGNNSAGELGDGGTGSRETPDAVLGLGEVWRVATYSRHTCAITLDRGVACWGVNRDGQLGDGTTTNATVPSEVLFGRP